MEALRLQNVSKVYINSNSKLKALDNINLSVNKGEFIAILGSSGSGKSTLLHIIGGVDEPTSGDVIIDGENIFTLDDDTLSSFRRNKIGLIYQFYNLLPTLNVRENILLPSKLEGKEVPTEFLNELLKSLGLSSHVKHFPHELSGGQEQRVAIARSLIARPSLLLADEPTGNLDSKNSYEIIDLLKEANEKYGQTIVMVTHDIKLALYAKRIITLEDGHIISDEMV